MEQILFSSLGNLYQWDYNLKKMVYAFKIWVALLSFFLFFFQTEISLG